MKVFFYVQEHGAPERAAFQHPIIVIAEGLKKLGLPYFSDKNYWRLSPGIPEYLFMRDLKVTAGDCDVVVVNSTWMHYTKALPPDLFHLDRKYKTVYVDDDDGFYTHSMTPAFRQFDVILRTHYNRKYKYPKNIHPWQFGFSERMAEALGEYKPYAERSGGVLYNFSVQHSIRKFVKERFLPGLQELFALDSKVDTANIPTASFDRMMWEQTGRRHNPSYFARLKDSKASLAFGGYFSSPWPRSISNPLLRKMNGLIARFGLKTSTVSQFDSWRFWESILAGCVTFHVYLERYGAVLPVMPKNWEHYVGVDLDDIEGSLAAIKNNLHRFPEISKNGREWVLKNYAPMAIAERFLKIVSSTDLA